MKRKRRTGRGGSWKTGKENDKNKKRTRGKNKGKNKK